MSPTIFVVPAIDPSQLGRRFREEIGWTSAMGFPKRVMQIDLRVLRTCSRTAEQLALNSQIEISFKETPLVLRLDDNHRLCGDFRQGAGKGMTFSRAD
jgi:hypothetical protein